MNGKHRTRNTSSLKFILIIGRSRFCSNTVHTKSLGGVCLKDNNRGFPVIAIKMHVDVILLCKRLL